MNRGGPEKNVEWVVLLQTIYLYLQDKVFPPGKTSLRKKPVLPRLWGYSSTKRVGSPSLFLRALRFAE